MIAEHRRMAVAERMRAGAGPQGRCALAGARLIAAGLMAAGSIAGCTQAGDGADASSGPDDRAPPARIVGEAQSCLPLAQIRSSTVRSDWTIDFTTSGGRIYRVTLPQRCPGLGRERAFTYSTSISRLCDSEIITVISTGGSGVQPLASCGLAPFQPIELVEK